MGINKMQIYTYLSFNVSCMSCFIWYKPSSVDLFNPIHTVWFIYYQLSTDNPFNPHGTVWCHIGGSVQNCSNSSALAVELL